MSGISAAMQAALMQLPASTEKGVVPWYHMGNVKIGTLRALANRGLAQSDREWGGVLLWRRTSAGDLCAVTVRP